MTTLVQKLGKIRSHQIAWEVPHDHVDKRNPEDEEETNYSTTQTVKANEKELADLKSIVTVCPIEEPKAVNNVGWIHKSLSLQLQTSARMLRNVEGESTTEVTILNSKLDFLSTKDFLGIKHGDRESK